MRSPKFAAPAFRPVADGGRWHLPGAGGLIVAGAISFALWGGIIGICTIVF